MSPVQIAEFEAGLREALAGSLLSETGELEPYILRSSVQHLLGGGKLFRPMLALATRFEKGRISARDAQRIIGAGLRGAGYDVSDADVARMRSETGAAGFIDIVARLLTATFGGGGSGPTSASAPEGARGPFPGTT